MDARQRVGCNHVAHDLNRVVVHDAYVGESTFTDAFQQRTDAGSEDFDAEEIDIRPRLRNRHRGFAHAAADFENRRRITVESPSKIDRSGRVRNAERRQQMVERVPLRLREAATP